MIYLLLALLFSSVSQSHISSESGYGYPLRWKSPSVGIQISHNSSSISTGQSQNIINQALVEWNQAGNLQLYQSSSSSNKISYSNNFSIYGSSVVGVTTMSYNSSGIIEQASILLNEQNFNFSDDPSVNFGGNIYLGNVITHELGHLAGLSHSEVMDSTMFYQAFKGQSTLAFDDVAGIRAKYGGSYGKISGRVLGGSSIGLYGVHVSALSLESGKVAAATVTDPSGDFLIKGLDTDQNYILFLNPLKNLSSLPSSMSSVQSKFCPGSYALTFYHGCNGAERGFPQTVSVTSSSPTQDVGDITVRCHYTTPNNYLEYKSGLVNTPVSIWDYAEEEKYQKSVTGFFYKSFLSELDPLASLDEWQFDLTGFDTSAGIYALGIKLLVFPFGSPLEFSMAWSRVDASADLGVVSNYDPALILTDYDSDELIPLSNVSSNNDLTLSLNVRALNSAEKSTNFPDATNFILNGQYPYLMVLSLKVWQGGQWVTLQDQVENYPNNTKCLDAPFAYKVEEAQAADNGELITAVNQEQVPTSCGTINPSAGDGDGTSGPGSAGLGVFLGLFLINLLRRKKKVLS